MKSGKSTHLLMTKHNYTSQNKNVLVFTNSLDTRWGTGIGPVASAARCSCHWTWAHAAAPR